MSEQDVADAEIRPIRAEESFPVRGAVLRPGWPPEKLGFPDDDADTLYLGAFVGGRLVGTARVSRDPPPGEDDADAWRLRAMATLPGYRDQGIGGRVLEAAVAYARERGASRLWCNARVRARPFYERAGFVAEGDIFDVPESGPHYFMWRRLP